MWALLLMVMASGAEGQEFSKPSSDKPEFGHGVNADQALDGWIALFDGRTDFGWKSGEVAAGEIRGGETTSYFAGCEIVGVAEKPGALCVGDQAFSISQGRFAIEAKPKVTGPVVLQPGLRLKSLLLRPSGLTPIWNGRDLAGWKVLRHPKLPADRQTIWKVEDAKLQARGGPGAVEYQIPYRNLVLQIVVKTRAPLVNGGVFFRSIPGDFMNGYEAQIFNACYEQDPARPARYSTGAIDDRQLARRLVSRDVTPFLMTVMAQGPHLATWVNGYQMTDWIDTRDERDNPRSGLRLKAGTIQLQAHDAGSDLEFQRIAVAEIE